MEDSRWEAFLGLRFAIHFRKERDAWQVLARQRSPKPTDIADIVDAGDAALLMAKDLA